MLVYHSDFDKNERFLKQLCDDDDEHRQVIAWEANERERLEEWVTLLRDNPPDPESVRWPDRESVEQHFSDCEKITFPDEPFPEGLRFQSRRIMVRLMGTIMKKARELDRRCIFTMVMNRATVLRDEEDENAPHQNALNGDHKVTSAWLHNFVCTVWKVSSGVGPRGDLQTAGFVMDRMRTRTGLTRAISLDQASKMPIVDEESKTFDDTPDKDYTKGVKQHIRFVGLEL